MSKAGLLADPVEVRAILVASARAQQPISYAEVLGLLGHQFSRPKMRALCKVLSFIDEEAQERGEPELAVLVVRQSDGLPGQGWWVSCAKKHGYAGSWKAKRQRASSARSSAKPLTIGQTVPPRSPEQDGNAAKWLDCFASLAMRRRGC